MTDEDLVRQIYLDFEIWCPKQKDTVDCSVPGTPYTVSKTPKYLGFIRVNSTFAGTAGFHYSLQVTVKHAHVKGKQILFLFRPETHKYILTIGWQLLCSEDQCRPFQTQAYSYTITLYLAYCCRSNKKLHAHLTETGSIICMHNAYLYHKAI